MSCVCSGGLSNRRRQGESAGGALGTAARPRGPPLHRSDSDIREIPTESFPSRPAAAACWRPGRVHSTEGEAPAARAAMAPQLWLRAELAPRLRRVWLEGRDDGASVDALEAARRNMLMSTGSTLEMDRRAAAIMEAAAIDADAAARELEMDRKAADIREAACQCQLLRAAGALRESPAALPEDEGQELLAQAERVRRVIQECTTPLEADGWKRLEIANPRCTLWRCWTRSGELKTIIRYETEGSLMQLIASLRDIDVSEPFWDGAAWDMSSEHQGGTFLVRWKQNHPVGGTKQEVILERVLCDCLDDELPCWVMSERSPAVECLQDFSGRYGSFDIPAVEEGHSRAVTTESGRIIEPIGCHRCRVSMAFSFVLPKVVKWLATDSVLALCIRLTAQSTMKSWRSLVDQWDTTGYEERIKRDSHFYQPVAERIVQHLERQRDDAAVGR